MCDNTGDITGEGEKAGLRYKNNSKSAEKATG